MANTYTVSRTHLIFGVCLPLAVLLGYLLADPLESSSLSVVVLVLAVLATPLLMKFYHPALVLSWNSAFYLPFLPGAPSLWSAFACLGAVVLLANRCINPQRHPMFRGAVVWSLLCIAAVVGVTAMATGGIGSRVLGSSTYGGKKYFEVAVAIIGYFVLVSRRIPPARATMFAGLFFLSGGTYFLGDLAYMAGETFYVVYYFISPATVSVPESDLGGMAMRRVTGLGNLSSAVCLFMLVRYGMSGILDLGRPWRLVITGLFMFGGLFGGFRSYIGNLALTFLVMFFLEGLHRTRKLFVLAVLATTCAAGLVAFSTRLPLSVQRALSFLPIEIDLVAKSSAEYSWEWRLEMWRELAHEVPSYFFKGKGYVIDPTAMVMSQENIYRGFGRGSEWAELAGDYHNGPLSVLIPFGIWGMLAFVWFLVVAGRQLCMNCVRGDPALGTINRVLYACFLVKIVFFFFLVGGFSTDMAVFVSLIGLGMSLNGESQEREE